MDDLPADVVEYLQAHGAMIDLLVAMVSADETPDEFFARQTDEGRNTLIRWAAARQTILPW